MPNTVARPADFNELFFQRLLPYVKQGQMGADDAERFLRSRPQGETWDANELAILQAALDSASADTYVGQQAAPSGHLLLAGRARSHFEEVIKAGAPKVSTLAKVGICAAKILGGEALAIAGVSAVKLSQMFSTPDITSSNNHNSRILGGAAAAGLLLGASWCAAEW